MPPKLPIQSTTLLSFFKVNQSKKAVITPAPTAVTEDDTSGGASKKRALAVNSDDSASDSDYSGDDEEAGGAFVRVPPSEAVRSQKLQAWVGAPVLVLFASSEKPRWYAGTVRSLLARGKLRIDYEDGTSESARYPDRNGHVVITAPDPNGAAAAVSAPTEMAATANMKTPEVTGTATVKTAANLSEPDFASAASIVEGTALPEVAEAPAPELAVPDDAPLALKESEPVAISVEEFMESSNALASVENETGTLGKSADGGCDIVGSVGGDASEEEDAGEKLSEYELLRLERIQRNAAFMESLGLDELKPQKKSKTAIVAPTAQRRRQAPKLGSKKTVALRESGVRRSSRSGAGQAPAPFTPFPDGMTEATALGKLPGDPASLTASRSGAAKHFEEDEGSEEEFEDSTVLSYLCFDHESNSTTSATSPKDASLAATNGAPKDKGGDGIDLSRFSFAGSHPDTCATSDRRRVTCFKALPELTPLSGGTKGRYYSIDSDPRSGLLVAGGQGGKVSLFRFRDSSFNGAKGSGYLGGGSDNPPLLSFKPHGSTWVSDVVFCGGTDGGMGGGGSSARAARLLTSANDGCVALWDLTKTTATSSRTSAAPRPVHAKQQWHRGGIWAMHANEALVATGSKDGSVGLGRIGPHGLEQLHTSGVDLDRGPVKSVHVRTDGVSSCSSLSSENHSMHQLFGNIDGAMASDSTSSNGVIACGCGDGSIVVLDSRDPRSGQGQMVSGGAHGDAACVAVEWRPGGCG